ncbi:MAG: CBS domain-containing protein [Candidatus Nitrosopumilus sp. bin_32a]
MILLPELNSILKKPISTDKNLSLSHVISEFLKHNISRLIVTDENSPIGIITEKDIGLFLLNDETEKNLDDIPASQIMNPIISVLDSVDLKTCVEIMLDKQIGSLGVTSNKDELIGIITKTDIVKHYAQTHAGKHKVGDVMTISYLSMNTDHFLSDVVSKMINEKISRVFLKNENNDPEGIMTFRDLFHIALEQGNSDAVLDNSDQSISIVFTRKGFLSDSGFGNTIKAKDVMTKNFKSVDFEDDLIVACDTMVQNRINGVGVRINGKLGGVVSKTDILKAIYIDNNSE